MIYFDYNQMFFQLNKDDRRIRFESDHTTFLFSAPFLKGLFTGSFG